MVGQRMSKAGQENGGSCNSKPHGRAAKFSKNFLAGWEGAGSTSFLKSL